MKSRVAVLGRNGKGKSTLLQLMMGEEEDIFGLEGLRPSLGSVSRVNFGDFSFRLLGDSVM